MAKCTLCVRSCQVNRTKGERGYCGAGNRLVVYSYAPHYGEEPPVSGKKGSGTIFFSHCPMGCVYCQNYQFSQKNNGKTISIKRLAEIMLELERMGCHNINLVTPTHFMPQILEGLYIAYSGGLDIPIVYNSGGYDSLHVIKLLEGIVDIYLPDMKYSSNDMAVKYSSSPDYVENNRIIVKEMFRQVGNLELVNDIAKKGIIIRLLMLPNKISGTEDTLEFIAENLGKNVYLSVMSQYYPANKALLYKELARHISSKEHNSVTKKIEGLGLKNGWVQPFNEEFDPNLQGENFESNL